MPRMISGDEIIKAVDEHYRPTGMFGSSVREWLPCAKLECKIWAVELPNQCAWAIKHNGNIEAIIPLTAMWQGWNWRQVLATTVRDMSAKCHHSVTVEQSCKGDHPEYPAFGSVIPS